MIVVTLLKEQLTIAQKAKLEIEIVIFLWQFYDCEVG